MKSESNEVLSRPEQAWKLVEVSGVLDLFCSCYWIAGKFLAQQLCADRPIWVFALMPVAAS